MPKISVKFDRDHPLWKLESLDYRVALFDDSVFSSFDTIQACDRQTDRRTHDDSIYHTSIASRGKNDSYKHRTTRLTYTSSTVVMKLLMILPLIPFRPH